MRNPHVVACFVLLGFGLSSASHHSYAATKVWSGAGASSYWQNGANWVGGAAPAPPNDGLVFTGGNRLVNTNDWGSGKIFTGITFDAGASAFVLNGVTGGTVTLTGFGITNNSSSLQVVNCALRANGPVSFAANTNDLEINGPVGTTSGTGTLIFSGTATTRVSGVISVTGGISLQGGSTATLLLSATNSYNGDTIINGGTLRLGESNVIPDGPLAGDVVFNPASGAARLDMAGHDETVNGLASSGAGTSMIDNSTGASLLTMGAKDASSTFSGTITNSTGSLGLLKMGLGTITLVGACTHAGSNHIVSGTLVLGSGWRASGPVTVADKAVLGLQFELPDGAAIINQLTLGNAPTDLVTNRFLFGTVPNSGQPVAVVSNALVVNGIAVIEVVGTEWVTGVTFPLLRYGTLGGSGSFKVGTMPAGFTGVLTTNLVERTISLTLSDGSTPNEPTNTVARPNILLIMADQWRGAALSFGPDHDLDVRTPHLDSLASQGIRFDRCYATYPLCTPNRAVLITGRYPTQTGMMDNDLMLPPDIPCLADVFKDASYATYYCGKYHIDGTASPGYVPKSPNDWRRRGYTTFEGFNRGHDYFENSEIFNDNGQVIPVPTNNPAGNFDEKYLANYEPHREADLASAFIRANAARPWFVHLSWGAPHSPYSPPAVFNTYTAASLTARPNNPTRQAMSSLAGYYGAIEALDYEVGRLTQLIEDLGLSSRTLIIFTSDHGDMLGSHGLSTKNKPEDESLRVPLLMRWAGKIPAGTTNDFLISTMDLMPTILKLAGLEIPAGTTGRDKSGIALGGTLAETPVFGISSVGWRSVVKRKDGKLYKLVMENVPPFQTTKFWNLTDDPYELTNQVGVAGMALTQAELEQEILSWQGQVGDTWPAQSPATAQTSYSFTPTTVAPVTIQLRREGDGSLTAQVPSQSRVTFQLQSTEGLTVSNWTNTGSARSGNGNVLNFPVGVDQRRTNEFLRMQQSW